MVIYCQFALQGAKRAEISAENDSGNLPKRNSSSAIFCAQVDKPIEIGSTTAMILPESVWMAWSVFSDQWGKVSPTNVL